MLRYPSPHYHQPNGEENERETLMKTYHKIGNALDAYWFLHEHPKLQRQMRTEVSPKEARKMEKAGYLISRDRSGKCWRYYRHGPIPAICENLSIFYTRTNKPGGHGRVDDDKSKNKFIECWLEFGTVEYGYACGDVNADWDVDTHEMNYHDYKVDSGGSTFDDALVMLARKVRKEYGDYSPQTRADKCGKPVCGDCVGTSTVKWKKSKTS